MYIANRVISGFAPMHLPMIFGSNASLTIKDFVNGDFTSGEVKYDLSNGGVGYEVTDHLSDEVVKFVEDRITSK